MRPPGRKWRVVNMLDDCPHGPCRSWDIRSDVHKYWTIIGHTDLVLQLEIRDEHSEVLINPSNEGVVCHDVLHERKFDTFA